MGINPDLYEAAALDGANRWNIVVHIILPALLVPMTTMFILNLGFLDGKMGWILSTNHYFYTMNKYIKLYFLYHDEDGRL